MRNKSRVSIVLALLWGGVSFAGPITPPPGPVASTHKTLTEIEPRIAVNATNTPGDDGDTPSLYRISAPGSYYLTGNITGVAGRNGIEIAASGVTLDLNGYDVVGVPGSFEGIVTPTFSGASGITVKNGTVRSWGSTGVALFTTTGQNYRVEGVHALDNGFYGLQTSSVSMVVSCTATGNMQNGINTGTNSAVIGCVALENSSAGILVANGSLIRDCVANDNISHGFVAGNACTILDCTAFSNAGNGISTASADGCTIARCTANGNVLNGIRVTNDSHVRDNTCDGNGDSTGDGAGILATGTDNRIEGNACTDADRGIDVDGAGNIIIRNTCSGNTLDWTIAANNVFGPIVDRRAPASGAVSGFSAASSLVSTDANANYSY